MLNVHLSEQGDEMDLNEVVDRARDSKLRLVALTGGIKANPDIKTITKAMKTLGKDVLIVCGADDSIEALCRTGASFLLKTKAPTPEQNVVNSKNFPLLQPADDILFEVSSQEELNAAIEFVQGRLITKPDLVFDVSKADASEKKGMVEILQDFSSRVVTGIRIHE